MGINFKIPKETDFEEIVKHSEGWLDWAPSKDTFLSLLEKKSYYIALQDNHIVWSFSFVKMWDDTIMIQYLRVKQEERKKWIGKEILKFINDLWVREKYEEIMSTVLCNNETSINFHKKSWFKESWIIKFYGGDELVFLKTIE